MSARHLHHQRQHQQNRPGKLRREAIDVSHIKDPKAQSILRGFIESGREFGNIPHDIARASDVTTIQKEIGRLRRVAEVAQDDAGRLAAQSHVLGLEAQVRAKQEDAWIEESPKRRMYARALKTGIKSIHTSAAAVRGGLVVVKPGKAQYVSKILDTVASGIPIAPWITAAVSAGINFADGKYQVQAAAYVVDMCDPTRIDNIVSEVTRQATRARDAEVMRMSTEELSSWRYAQHVTYEGTFGEPTRDNTEIKQLGSKDATQMLAMVMKGKLPGVIAEPDLIDALLQAAELTSTAAAAAAPRDPRGIVLPPSRAGPSDETIQVAALQAELRRVEQERVKERQEAERREQERERERQETNKRMARMEQIK